MKKTRVLIVDDSAVVRKVMTEILASDPSIEVISTAPDPYVAWDKIQKLKPDMITLDVEMPRMDGLTFLDKLMRAHPMPVLMVSSLTEKGAETTLRALELGAIDFVTKPKIDVAHGTEEIRDEIVTKVKVVAGARVRKRAEIAAAAVPEPPAASPLPAATDKVLAVGSSTGGTEALRVFLSGLPADAPGVVAVQHMPPGFTSSFAKRLDSMCRVRVSEAKDGDRVLRGHALLAPGDLQMEVRRSGGETFVRIHPGERVNHHRPSVDVLFHSCARHLGRNAVALILTGMGADGARGMLAMRQAGARTAAQDEATSVVFGMPREAIALGAVEEVVPIHQAAATVMRLAAG